MDDERETTRITDATDLFTELREQVNLEALGQGRLDSVALGISGQTASLSEEEFLDLSGDRVPPHSLQPPARLRVTMTQRGSDRGAAAGMGVGDSRDR